MGGLSGGLVPIQVRCGRKRQVGGAVTLLSRGGGGGEREGGGAQRS